jgi:hypothetical protein
MHVSSLPNLARTPPVEDVCSLILWPSRLGFQPLFCTEPAPISQTSGPRINYIDQHPSSQWKSFQWSCRAQPYSYLFSHMLWLQSGLMLVLCHNYRDSITTSSTCDRICFCTSRMQELSSRATTIVPTLDSQWFTKHACRRAHINYTDIGTRAESHTFSSGDKATRKGVLGTVDCSLSVSKNVGGIRVSVALRPIMDPRK